MINRTMKTLVIASMSLALLGATAQAKNNNNSSENRFQKSEKMKKTFRKTDKKRMAVRQIKSNRTLKKRTLSNKRNLKTSAKRKNSLSRIQANRQNKMVAKRQNKRVQKNLTPPDKRITTPKTVITQDKRVTTPKTVVTQKPIDPTSDRLNARKNKDEYFKCAKFSTTVLNACIADANRKGQTTKSCLTHYQGNIGRCQAKFL